MASRRTPLCLTFRYELVGPSGPDIFSTREVLLGAIVVCPNSVGVDESFEIQCHFTTEQNRVLSEHVKHRLKDFPYRLTPGVAGLTLEPAGSQVLVYGETVSWSARASKEGNIAGHLSITAEGSHGAVGRGSMQRDAPRVKDRRPKIEIAVEATRSSRLSTLTNNAAAMIVSIGAACGIIYGVWKRGRAWLRRPQKAHKTPTQNDPIS